MANWRQGVVTGRLVGQSTGGEDSLPCAPASRRRRITTLSYSWEPVQVVCRPAGVVRGHDPIPSPEASFGVEANS